MDPQTGAALGSAGISAFANAQAGEQGQAVAQYNATAFKQQAGQVSAAADANMAASIRKGAAALGEQAAAFGEANVGTGGSARDIERMSAGNARLDALNQWYGGELERRQFMNASRLEQWQADQLNPAKGPFKTLNLIGNLGISKSRWYGLPTTQDFLGGDASTNLSAGTAMLLSGYSSRSGRTSSSTPAQSYYGSSY